MSNDWRWLGARWWKCDFHMHTPASYDFTNRETVSPAQWVAAARAAELDAVAVTDHNTGEYIESIKAASAAEGRELVVFPGVELTVNPGLHLLAIFPPDRNGDAATALLVKCDVPDDRYGRPEAVAQCTFDQALERARKRGAICIAAHVDGPKGLLKELVKVTPTAEGNRYSGSQTLQTTLRSEHLAAVEANQNDAALLAFIDGSKPEYRRRLGPLPVLTFSDAHALDDIGIRYTWLKMTTPSVEGIRLALLDGEEHSVRRGEATEFNPNLHATNVIEAIEIRDARYLGRGGPFTLRFNPWLNSIIGGRGTGKSTVIELLRIVADREDEIPERLQEEFAKYRTPYQSRDDAGLLHTDAKISLFYRKEDARFRIDWSLSDDARTIHEEQDNGVWTQVEGDVKQRFPVRIYSQKQVFELAREPLALLRVIDDAEEVDRVGWDEEWREVEAAFLSHRAKVRELQTGLAEESRLRGELDDVKRKLQVFETAGHADVLKAYQRRLRQRRVVEAWEQSWKDTAERIRKFSETVEPASIDPTPFDGDDDADSSILDAAAAVQERFRAIADEVAKLADASDSVLQGWESTRPGLLWTSAVDQAVDAYEELKKKLEDEDAGDPNEYGRLVEERQRLEERLKGFDLRREEIAEERRLAEECLSKLVELRRDLTSRRAQFIDGVIGDNPYVRIEVVPYGARDTVEPGLRQLLARETGGFEKDIGSIDTNEGLVARIYGATSVEDGLKGVKTWIRDVASGATQDVLDKRFATYLSKLAPEHLDRIDCWFPEDSLEVRYSTTSDGNNFRSIQEGSPGQKTAALLAFLLSYGKEPIILDQPEDDLDNNLIYGLIVTQLKRIKRERQVIVVTHNANIVVNGDAEYVAALSVGGGQTRIGSDGGLQEDDVRKTICDIMEGGEKAFEARYRRIRGAHRA